MGVPGQSGITWRRSTRSTGADNCTEVASTEEGVAVRDSKDPYGPVLGFTPRAWHRFIAEIRRGMFDPPGS